MKTLYLDCSMGAAGDMLTAALLELTPDPDRILAQMNALGLPGVAVKTEPSVKCGIQGTHVSVLVYGQEETSGDVSQHASGGAYSHPHEAGRPYGHPHAEGCPHEENHLHGQAHGEDYAHSHAHGEDHAHGHSHTHEENHPHGGLGSIVQLVHTLPLPEKVRADILAVYGLIAEAESAVHGMPVSEIHFHEVGTMDAVADITAVCLLMHELAPAQVIVSPVHVGSGQVRCAHGILPVPAPATAHLLREVPIYGGQVRGELCTPTGAALLKHFATRFGEMPVMRAAAIGYGMGKKDFEAANCVRAILGEAEAAQSEICELSCNVDDMTAEAAGFAMERLFEAGALDVYTAPIGMKKSRPGVLIHVLCREADRQEIVKAMFRHTTTIGIRESRLRRYVLDRRIDTLDTPYGPVRRKVSSGYGAGREKYEYEDLARIAREKGVGLSEAVCLVENFLKG